MKYNLRLVVTLLILLFNNAGFTQELQNLKIQLGDSPVEEKLSYSVERIDVNICMGIAYAKSLGKTVEDFAEHVGAKDNLTGRNDTSIEKVVQSIHFVITCYPKGEFEILTESDSSVEMRWNKPYSDYFNRAALHGVTLDEFETYLYRYVEAMANKIGYNFDHTINSDHVTAILSSVPNPDIKDLIGTWNIIDFEIIGNEMSDKISKDKIKENGLVWDLFLMENGEFKQSSNMSETGTMDSHEGGWRAWDENLTISFQMNDRKFDMNYTYDLKENILVLMRSNPMGTMKIISQFKKK